MKKGLCFVMGVIVTFLWSFYTLKIFQLGERIGKEETYKKVNEDLGELINELDHIKNLRKIKTEEA